MTLEQLKSELEKINQGCEKRFEISENRLAICGRYYYDEKEQTLCPTCQAEISALKKGIILGAKMMIEEIRNMKNVEYNEENTKKFTTLVDDEWQKGYYVGVNSLFKSIEELADLKQINRRTRRPKITKQENDNRTIHIRLPNNISNYCFNNNL